MANGRGKVDGVANPVAGAGIDADELVALADFYRVQHAKRLAPAALRANAHAEKCLHIGQSAAVENRQLQVVDLDDHVVDAHADEGREQVFGGGDQHALAHQTGRVAHFGHVAAGGGNLEVIQVGAPEDNPRTRCGGQQTHGDWRS